MKAYIIWIFVGLLNVGLIALKLIGYSDWPWWLVVIPPLIALTSVLLLVGLALLAAHMLNRGLAKKSRDRWGDRA